MPKYEKMHECHIKMPKDMWKEICRIGNEVEGDQYEKSGSRIVRRCVQYCFRQGIVTKLAHMKEWV